MWRRWFSTSLAVLVPALLVLAILRAPRDSGRLNVLILTVESFRAEAISPDLTPNLWAAAREGTRFTGHHTVSAWTVPNIIAVLEGVSPFAQGVHTRGNHLPATWPLPLKSLAAAGWEVGGLQAFMNMDVFQNLGLTVEAGREPLSWLAEQALGRHPFVLWYHYLDTHLPYNPPLPFRPDLEALLPAGDTAARARLQVVMAQPVILDGSVPFRPEDRPAIQALYQGNVRRFDVWFGELWRFLEQSGLRRNTMVILTADHGDEHLEHGHLGHASTNHAGHLHGELVRVPLVVWVPPRLSSSRALAGTPLAAGRTVATLTSHLDLMPTVLDLQGLASPRPLPGRSLARPLADRPWSAVTSRAGFSDPDPTHIREFIAAREEGSWKLMLRVTPEADTVLGLYDLARDPGEKTDASASRPDLVARLRAPLLREVRAMRPPSGDDGPETAMAAETVPRPEWVFPTGSGAVRQQDVAAGFTLRWSGVSGARYVLQYRAGTPGGLHLEGEMEIAGPEKAFGGIDRRYWETFLRPYGVVRLRVSVKGQPERGSPWIVLTLEP